MTPDATIVPVGLFLGASMLASALMVACSVWVAVKYTRRVLGALSVTQQECAWQAWTPKCQPQGKEPVVLRHNSGRLSIMEWDDDLDDFVIEMGGHGDPTHWMRPAPVEAPHAGVSEDFVEFMRKRQGAAQGGTQ